ncbi:AAA domain-containing protein [Janthinobacterium fluminis]|uniref:AAA domain-containing protein n=1 Tax=Janthinobacterium fluminis TaxID=2987524 RepID=A0ABT5JV66_9BURK|nr:AAA domain-containing protein [Janthinobacterium fluminis]MDC8756381.1 AAA domain-containing protein [Janthinobacterium fluminis]
MKQGNAEALVNATNFWAGIECLSPNSAPKIGIDEASNSISWDIACDRDMPWADPGKLALLAARTRKAGAHANNTWRFVAYCSLMEMAPVIQELRDSLGVTADEFGEYRASNPAATLAFPLNIDGMVTDLPFISSMPWAIAQVKATKPGERINFFGFFGFNQFQQQLSNTIVELLLQRGCLARNGSEALAAAMPKDVKLDSDVNGRCPLSLQDVGDFCRLAFQRCGWTPPSIAQELRVQAKVVSAKSAKAAAGGADGVDMLNSFFVEDILMVERAIRDDNLGPAAAAFMAARWRSDRVDVRADGRQALAEAVEPAATPLACWPSEHPLVLAQQFAVNTIHQRLADGAGLFSVNGPPGTGKTTLLRDVIADIVVERAIVMASFADPQSAFGEEIGVTVNTFGQKAWTVDPRLCGGSIVVASANNGAVENITKELPARQALPKGSALQYFPTVSDSLAASTSTRERKVGASWGLFAAALGSKQNRKAFFQQLRWPPAKLDKGEAPPAHPKQSLWEVIQGQHQAKPWQQARADFAAAIQRATASRQRMQQIADALRSIGKVSAAHENTAARLKALRTSVELLGATRTELSVRDAAAGRHYQMLAGRHAAAAGQRTALAQLAAIDKAWTAVADAPALARTLDDEQTAASEQLRQCELLLTSHVANKPGWWHRLRDWQVKARWSAKLDEARLAFQQAAVDKERTRLALQAQRKLLQRHADLAPQRAKAQTDCQLSAAACIRAGLDPALADKLDPATLAKARARRDACADALQAVDAQLAPLQARELAAQQEAQDQRTVLETQRSLLRLWAVDEKMAANWLGSGRSDEQLQLAAPWHDQEHFEARQALFCAAMELQAAFVVASWPKLSGTLGILAQLNLGTILPSQIQGDLTRLWQALFLLVPVVSTTFASFPRMFKSWGRESIGWLLIDEAGQASPQQALGAIWRARRAVLVGDPLQLEPIVNLPAEALDPLRIRCGARTEYDPNRSSAQVLADMANPVGTLLGQGEQQRWVGSPLRVHRRCLETMFRVSNAIAYDGMMVYGTSKDERQLWFGDSCWIDVPAREAKGNCIPAQIERAISMVKEFKQEYGLKKDGKFNLYLITPFRDVNGALEQALGELLGEAKDGMHGTVHTFQGKEADIVILVLGGDPAKPMLIPGFAAAKPNLLNVAVTRAKKRVYVIGDHAQWSGQRFFDTLAMALGAPAEAPLIRGVPAGA